MNQLASCAGPKIQGLLWVLPHKGLNALSQGLIPEMIRFLMVVSVGFAPLSLTASIIAHFCKKVKLLLIFLHNSQAYFLMLMV